MVRGDVESGEEGHGISGLISSCSPKGANFTLLRCRVPFAILTNYLDDPIWQEFCNGGWALKWLLKLLKLGT